MMVGFCVSGKGRLALLAISHRAVLGFTVGLVLLGPSADTKLEQRLSELGISFRRLSNAREERDKQLFELMVLRGVCDYWMLTFDHLIPDSITQALSNRIINLHLSLLPSFTGLHALHRSIQGQSLVLGATCHLVDSTIDGGPIISQFVMPRRPTLPFENLEEEFAWRVSGLYLQTLRWFIEGRVCFIEQEFRVDVSGSDCTRLPHVPALENLVLSILKELDFSKAPG